MKRWCTIFLLCVIIVGCGSEPPPDAPPAAELSRDAIGHYCNMIVVDHQGPKGQIHLLGAEQPIWFTSVRDTLTFTFLPGEPKNIAAIYVNDMARASWDTPEPGTWIDARAAWYVLGSDRVGGMGAPEPVPFGNDRDARDFSEKHGGEVLVYSELPADYFTTPVTVSLERMDEQ